MPHLRRLLLICVFAVALTSGACRNGSGVPGVEATIEVTAVALSPAEGLPLAATTLTAATEGERPVAWEWEFADGALPATSTDENPEVVRQNAGTYTGRVRAQDDEGLWSLWFEFEYQVTTPVPPLWQVFQVATEAETAGITMHDGKLAIFYTNAARELVLMRAQVETPTSPADFASHIVTGEARLGPGFKNAVSIDDRLVVVYQHGPDGYAVAIADVAEPTSDADWTVYDLDLPFPNPARGYSLISRGDRLALVGCVGVGGLFFGQSSDVHPESDTDWSTHTLGLGLDGGNPLTPALSVIDGVLYAAYLHDGGNFVGEARLLRALEANPTAPSDWDLSLAYDIPLGVADLIEFEGKPALACNDAPDPWVGHDPVATILAFATSPEPATIDDYTRVQISLPDHDTRGGAWAESAGRLGVLFGDVTNGDLMLARQVGVDPTLSTSWVRQRVADAQGGGWLLDANGALAALWRDTSGTLRLGLANGPF